MHQRVNGLSSTKSSLQRDTIKAVSLKTHSTGVVATPITSGAERKYNKKLSWKNVRIVDFLMINVDLFVITHAKGRSQILKKVRWIAQHLSYPVVLRARWFEPSESCCHAPKFAEWFHVLQYRGSRSKRPRGTI